MSVGTVMGADMCGCIGECLSIYVCVCRYVFINVWIMLNVLVGILVDSYLKARAWVLVVGNSLILSG